MEGSKTPGNDVRCFLVRHSRQQSGSLSWLRGWLLLAKPCSLSLKRSAMALNCSVADRKAAQTSGSKCQPLPGG